MKKIVIVLPTLPNYRKEFLNCLSEHLSAHDIELVVFHGFTKKKSIKNLDDKKFKVVAFETKEISCAGISFTLLKGLKKRIIDEKPDGIIMLFNPAIISFVNVLYLCLKKHIPYAIWSCGYVRPELSGILVRIREMFLNYFDKRAKAHIAYHTMRKDYLLNIGIDPKVIFVAQNTIDTESIINSYKLDDVNALRYGEKLKILFVGALIKGKYLKEAMTAIDALISSQMSILFYIIGGGDIFDDLKAHQNTLINKNNFYILGPKYGEELKSYFLNSDVFLLAGSGGLAINEAMAYGLPIISTNGDGSVRDLIDNNGYMLEKFGNVIEIQNAITNFYKLTDNEKIAMSNNSLRIVKKKATISIMVENYSKAISILLNR